MRAAYSIDKVRAAELALMARVPDGALMQRAAAGLAAVCGRVLTGVYGSRVTLLIGGGDNGGDALYAGARLARRGARVAALLAGAKVHQAGLAAFLGAGGRTGDASQIDEADLIVDGLVGIGGRGPLRQPYADLAAVTEGVAATVVAVDVPSGVDASTGQVEGPAVAADVTVTFGAHKPGLLVDPGAAHAGVVELVDIGLGPYLPDPDVVAPQAEDVADLLPRPGTESDKYRRGVVGVVAGSDQYSGAAVLAVGGAVRGGAGMVRFVSTAEPVNRVREHWPEAVTTIIAPGDDPKQAGRVQAWVLGPGLGTGEAARKTARAVLASDVPVLIDADGLTLVAADRTLLRRSASILITPHAGELGRLLGEPRDRIEARRLEFARRAAEELAVTVLLKGSTTLIAEVDRPVRVNPTGTPWLATGGTGDVLAGLAGALLAAGLSPYDAGSCAAYLHGLAARLAVSGMDDGHRPISAGDVAGSLPDAFRAVTSV